ncbi:isopenicillin N synthase family dioxygenase [Colwellia echini]|uniref:Isopenicillin N synthase family oxygenase n=1 Tax=Colwellia echini TaxID=1982103 RepID=A0ABY3N047_9GAMM|nr:2-oxoglutarate and iron-dependent oxygenase domain-containing protein [Colwellia echini]TYK66622.1 isopenicillin N synthase family oxygenase [Colwellia echini]
MTTPSNKPHKAFTELPVVDISLLYSEDAEERVIAAKSLDKAAREVGFLYLKGHQIPTDLINNLKRVVKNYFSQDEDEKMSSYIGLSKNHSGYVPIGEEGFYSTEKKKPDLKEAFDIGPDTPSLMKRFEQDAKIQWPKNKDFQINVKAYYDAMLELSRVLFKGFALALGLAEDTFTKHLTTPPSQLRLIHYFDNPDAKETDSGIGAHTDYEFFTILLPTAPGLQVLNGANEWINVPLVDDCFVINIGDMMELISNGQYVATSHRVRQVKEERYSFPFFSSLDYDTVVAPIEEFVTDNQVSSYEPLICGDHLLAQTIQTFSYLQKKAERGEVNLPENSRSLLSFGQSANKEG